MWALPQVDPLGQYNGGQWLVKYTQYKGTHTIVTKQYLPIL